MKRLFISPVLLIALAFGQSDLRAQWIQLGNCASSIASVGRMTIAQCGDEIFRTTDYGNTWLDTIQPSIYPIDINLIFAWKSRFFVTADFNDDQGSYIFASDDSGKTWVPSGKGYPGLPNVMLGLGDDTLLASSFPNGIYRSLDTGRNWVGISGPLDYDSTHAPWLISQSAVLSMAASEGNVYASLDIGGLIRSIDGGVTWHQILAVPPTRKCYSVGAIGSDIFAGVDTFGVYRSTNWGESWDSTNRGIPNGHRMDQIFVTPTAIYAEFSNSDGVYRSTDSGASWRALNEGPSSSWSLICIDTASGYLFAGAAGSLWRRPISDFASVQPSSTSSPEIELFPNPTPGPITVENADESVLHVNLLNVLGSEVGREYRGTGSGKVDLDLSELPTGTYFLKIETPQGIVMRKVVRE
jgi:photosystem II stability/assembly factor-like uncharacterized protein